MYIVNGWHSSVKVDLNVRILFWKGLGSIWSNTNARRSCGSELQDYHPEATLEGLGRRDYRALRKHEQ